MRLYFSKDGKNWENKTKGRFENSSSAQFVTLEKPIVARYFKLIALSEIYGRDWASAAELNVNAVRNLSGASEERQKVVYVDSDADGSMKLAADGDINTFWHTVHNQFYLAPYPHEIQIALAKETTVKVLNIHLVRILRKVESVNMKCISAMMARSGEKLWLLVHLPIQRKYRQLNLIHVKHVM